MTAHRRVAVRRRSSRNTRSADSTGILLDSISILWVGCAVTLYSSAWIWPADSAAGLEVDQAYVTQFKALVYSVFLIQGCRGVYFALQSRSAVAAVFIVQAVALLLSVIAGGDAFYGGQALAGFFGLTFGALGTYQSLGPWRMFKYISNFVLIILVLSILVAVGLPHLGQHGAPFQGQWRGLFNNKNLLGQMSFVGLAMTWPFLARKQYKRVMAGVSAATVCMWGSLSGTSMSVGLLSTALVGVYYSLHQLGAGQRSTLLALGVTAAIGLFMQDIVAQFVVSTLGKDLTFTGRDEVWAHMWAIGIERPFTGHGPYYLHINQAMMDWIRVQVAFPQLRSAHNAYIEAVVESGFVGLAAMSASYFVVLWRWGRSRFAARPLGILVLSVLIPVAVYNNFESTNHLFAGIGTLLANLLLIASFHPGKVRVMPTADDIAASGRTCDGNVTGRRRPRQSTE